jgi:hypothetical protein
VIHIVNGDIVAERLRPVARERWNEEVWVYRELLTEGPVYPIFERYLAYRALQLEKMCGLPASLYLQMSNEQERSWKADVLRHPEIALWFEHDLFDITMLLRLTERLSREHPEAAVYWIDIAAVPGHDRYDGFGALDAEQLARYREHGIRLTVEAITWMHHTWLAYTSPNPRKLVRWLEESGTVEAPYDAIVEAMWFHLRRFPSREDGLGAVERLTLDAVADGASSFLELYQHIRPHVPEYGLGDMQYWGYLRRLISGEAPLLSLSAASDPMPEPLRPVDPSTGRVLLTEAGRRVRSGESNWARERGYARWLGGAFVTNPAP